jgi:hypothetical protein
MNPTKTAIWWPRVSPTALGGLPSGMAICHDAEVRLLGAVMSASQECLREAVAVKALEACTVMSRLDVLRDPQSELLVLRSCAGLCKIVHLLRCSTPEVVDRGGCPL